jgi:hypothetical protein
MIILASEPPMNDRRSEFNPHFCPVLLQMKLVVRMGQRDAGISPLEREKIRLNSRCWCYDHRRTELADDATTIVISDDLAVRRALEATGVEFIDENGVARKRSTKDLHSMAALFANQVGLRREREPHVIMSSR